ncbi:hypothetical protein SteCoe_17741 [Stentor coeruleus]|uniref:RING-type domain-containing protein n=1 Tax=Stentor coeruleus TaxID=5963 RepID=A0A1R2BY72_9CILI|nr:hypothetical protein SteCoe_17741 [Stentor coeruleus]
MFLLTILCLQFHLAVSTLKVISPDELSHLDISYILSSYSNPNLQPTYGRLVFVDVLSNCKLSSTSSLGPETIAVLYAEESYNCDISMLGYNAEQAGCFGSLIIYSSLNRNDVFSNLYATNEIYRPLQSQKLITFSLLIDENTGSVLKSYEKNQIWVTYKYSDIKISDYPFIKYYMTSDFNQDKAYIDKIYDIVSNYAEIWVQELSLYSLFEEYYILYGNDVNYDEADCYTALSTLKYCLPPSGNISGKLKLINTLLILNVYESLSYSDILIFLDYLQTLYTTCVDTYNLACHEEILSAKNLTIDYSENPFKKGYSSFDMLQSISVNEVYIYSPEYFEQLYIMSSRSLADFKKCYLTCDLVNVTDGICSEGCNNTECGFDNLDCLRTQGCFSFMIGDGNCNKECVDDPDCGELKDNKKDDSFFIAVILVPICGLIIIILIIILIIAIVKYKKIKRKNLASLNSSSIDYQVKPLSSEVKAIPCFDNFNMNVHPIIQYPPIYAFSDCKPNVYSKLKIAYSSSAYSEKRSCSLDEKFFVDGESVIIAGENCEHIYHSKCYKKWSKDNQNSQGCPKCLEKS